MESHVSVLVLEVGLSVVASDPVGVCGGRALAVAARDLSVQVIIHPLEEPISQVQVPDGVDSFFEHHTARQLAVPVTPMMF